ncbi:MAG: hypothetical protein U5K43_03415 [Halofilum sp. (in: g-proteobacteria)]|nr:hypothetical protein [Halofilum sp. (in: g-proteobacteria)]
MLDEPTVGLDPIQVRAIRALIVALGHDHGVILSTHILPEVQAVCSRVAIMHRGRIAYAADTATPAGPPDAVVLRPRRTAARGGARAARGRDRGSSRSRRVASASASIRRARSRGRSASTPCGPAGGWRHSCPSNPASSSSS